MAANTINYGFLKPGEEEYYDIHTFNANMDDIDAAIANVTHLIGVMPIDGGTFFEEYDPFSVDGGLF